VAGTLLLAQAPGHAGGEAADHLDEIRQLRHRIAERSGTHDLLSRRRIVVDLQARRSLQLAYGLLHDHAELPSQGGSVCALEIEHGPDAGFVQLRSGLATDAPDVADICTPHHIVQLLWPQSAEVADLRQPLRISA